MSIKSKSEGNMTFWASGAIILLIGISMCFLILAHNVINKVNYSLEDSITFSTLGAALVDKDRYAITGDMYVKDAQECFDNFCDLFSENTGCGKFINGEASGSEDHRFFDFSDGKKIKITKFIIYNIPANKSVNTDLSPVEAWWGERYPFYNGSLGVYDGSNEDGIGRHSYGSEEKPIEMSPEVETKDGGKKTVPITSTSIFVEMEIPIKIGIFNIKGTITKTQIINIEKR